MGSRSVIAALRHCTEIPALARRTEIRITSETNPDPEDAGSWQEACRPENAVCKFVRRRGDNRKSPTVKELGQELGLSRATVYRMIGLIREHGTVTSLLGRAPGRQLLQS